MKVALFILAFAGLVMPMAACEHTVAENSTMHKNWDGSTTVDQTTVKKNDVTGTTTVDQQKGRY